MGRFCTKCGRPLAEGEVCNCQGVAPQPQQTFTQDQQVPPQGQAQYQQVSPQGQPQYQQVPPQGQPQYQQMAPKQPSAAENYLKELLNTGLNIFKAPVTEGKKYVAEGNSKLAIGYLVIQAILAMILGMTFEARSGLAKIGSYNIWSGGVDTGAVALTYVKVFFSTLVLSALFSLIFAGLLFAFNNIAKNKMTFQNALCLASVRSIVLVPAMVVAWGIILINPMLGGSVSLIINIWGMITIVKALPVASEKADNLITHLMTAAFVIFAIVSVGIMLTIGSACYCSGIISKITSIMSYL